MVDEKKTPLFEVKRGKNGQIRITAWKNPKGISYNVRKEYFDKTSNSFKKTDNYFPEELEELGNGIEDALEEVKKH